MASVQPNDMLALAGSFAGLQVGAVASVVGPVAVAGVGPLPVLGPVIAAGPVRVVGPVVVAGPIPMEVDGDEAMELG